jgi:hypothetical protein
VPDIRRTAELIADISIACREQDIGASQVNEAIQQMDKVTQHNAEAAIEISSTSEELATQADTLQSAVAFFRLNASQQHRETTPPPPRRPCTRAQASTRQTRQTRQTQGEHGEAPTGTGTRLRAEPDGRRRGCRGCRLWPGGLIPTSARSGNSHEVDDRCRPGIADGQGPAPEVERGAGSGRLDRA